MCTSHRIFGLRDISFCEMSYLHPISSIQTKEVLYSTTESTRATQYTYFWNRGWLLKCELSSDLLQKQPDAEFGDRLINYSFVWRFVSPSGFKLFGQCFNKLRLSSVTIQPILYNCLILFFNVQYCVLVDFGTHTRWQTILFRFSDICVPKHVYLLCKYFTKEWHIASLNIGTCSWP